MPSSSAFTRLIHQLSYLLLLLGSLLPSISTATGLDETREYEIKAVYLFNFASFISWPRTYLNIQRTHGSFDICILGKDPFTNSLEIVVENEWIAGNPVKIRHLEEYTETNNCGILFIDEDQVEQLEAIFKQLQKQPILTVSDMPDFAAQGGMIEFYNNEQNQVRFIIVPETLEQTGLTVSTELLEIAKIRHRPK